MRASHTHTDTSSPLFARTRNHPVRIHLVRKRNSEPSECAAAFRWLQSVARTTLNDYGVCSCVRLLLYSVRIRAVCIFGLCENGDPRRQQFGRKIYNTTKWIADFIASGQIRDLIFAKLIDPADNFISIANLKKSLAAIFVWVNRKCVMIVRVCVWVNGAAVCSICCCCILFVCEEERWCVGATTRGCAVSIICLTCARVHQ